MSAAVERVRAAWWLAALQDVCVSAVTVTISSHARWSNTSCSVNVPACPTASHPVNRWLREVLDHR